MPDEKQNVLDLKLKEQDRGPACDEDECGTEKRNAVEEDGAIQVLSASWYDLL